MRVQHVPFFSEFIFQDPPMGRVGQVLMVLRFWLGCCSLSSEIVAVLFAVIVAMWSNQAGFLRPVFRRSCGERTLKLPRTGVKRHETFGVVAV